jgi:hypothetical protein
LILDLQHHKRAKFHRRDETTKRTERQPFGARRAVSDDAANISGASATSRQLNTRSPLFERLSQTLSDLSSSN